MDWDTRLFYADGGILVSQDSEWLQGSLNVLIILFRRIGLADNVAKSKMITYETGAIILEMLVEMFGWCSTGKGAIYRERLRRKATCLYCRVEMTDVSVTAHRW